MPEWELGDRVELERRPDSPEPGHDEHLLAQLDRLLDVRLQARQRELTEAVRGLRAEAEAQRAALAGVAAEIAGLAKIAFATAELVDPPQSDPAVLAAHLEAVSVELAGLGAKIDRTEADRAVTWAAHRSDLATRLSVVYAAVEELKEAVRTLERRMDSSDPGVVAAPAPPVTEPRERF
jgi:hypothetical protein